jgi:hypothetical protein
MNCSIGHLPGLSAQPKFALGVGCSQADVCHASAPLSPTWRCHRPRDGDEQQDRQQFVPVLCPNLTVRRHTAGVVTSSCRGQTGTEDGQQLQNAGGWHLHTAQLHAAATYGHPDGVAARSGPQPGLLGYNTRAWHEPQRLSRALVFHLGLADVEIIDIIEDGLSRGWPQSNPAQSRIDFALRHHSAPWSPQTR